MICVGHLHKWSELKSILVQGPLWLLATQIMVIKMLIKRTMMTTNLSPELHPAWTGCREPSAGPGLIITSLQPRGRAGVTPPVIWSRWRHVTLVTSWHASHHAASQLHLRDVGRKTSKVKLLSSRNWLRIEFIFCLFHTCGSTLWVFRYSLDFFNISLSFPRMSYKNTTGWGWD